MLGPVSVHAAPEEDSFRGRSVRGTPTKLQGSLGCGEGSRQLLRVWGRLPLAAAPGEDAFCPNCPSQSPGPPLIVNKAPNKTLPKTKSNHVLLLLETTQGLSTPPRGQDDGPERPRSPARPAPSDPAPPSPLPSAPRPRRALCLDGLSQQPGARPSPAPAAAGMPSVRPRRLLRPREPTARPLAAAGPCQPPVRAGEGRIRLAREPCGPPQPCASPGTTPGTQPAPHGRCPREETSGERINRSSAARLSPAPRERRVALRGRAPSSLPWSAVSVCQPEAPAGAEPGAGPALARVYSPRPGLGRPPDRPSFPPGAPGAKPTRARQACP